MDSLTWEEHKVLRPVKGDECQLLSMAFLETQDSFILPNFLKYAEVGGDKARHWCGEYVVGKSETGAAPNKHVEVGS